ncbi:MAG: hypothetical protein V9E84_06495, partial [Trichococcus flocculiformis]
SHDSPPERTLGHAPIEHRPWPLRSTDLDGLGHVNNAATWEAVEDELTRRGLRATFAELEYRDAIDPGDTVTLTSTLTEDGRLALFSWLTVADTIRALRPGHRHQPPGPALGRM